MRDKLAVVTQVTAKYGPWVQIAGASLIIAGTLLEKKIKE